MSPSQERKNTPGEAAASTRPKRPYHRPEVRYEKVFETSALTCGKVQTTQGQCHSSRKNS
jgi:hypothetical protein